MLRAATVAQSLFIRHLNAARFSSHQCSSRGFSRQTTPLTRDTAPHQLTTPKNEEEEEEQKVATEKVEEENSEPELITDREKLLEVLQNTNSSDEAWDVFRYLMRNRDSATQQPAVPLHLMHRVVRLLSQTKPRTRRLYTRMLNVLTTLREHHGHVSLWEWNALIDCAGKGMRKLRVEDYNNALAAYREMLAARISQSAAAEEAAQKDFTASFQPKEDIKPNIITFTTLLDIASRIGSPGIMRHATGLLQEADIPFNIITRSVMMRYLMKTRQLEDVRMLFARMVEEDPGSITIAQYNAYMWAFVYNGRVEVALSLYSFLRARTFPDSPNDWTTELVMKESIDFSVATDIRPDRITYTLLVQGLCYQGNIRHALFVFQDMIQASALQASDKTLSISHTIYRAFFLGFARHGRPNAVTSDGRPFPAFSAHLAQSRERADAEWSFEVLDGLFESYLKSPEMVVPSERLVYWILVGYSRTTVNDEKILTRVWHQLRDRFHIRFGGRLGRVHRKLSRHARQQLDEEARPQPELLEATEDVHTSKEPS